MTPNWAGTIELQTCTINLISLISFSCVLLADLRLSSVAEDERTPFYVRLVSWVYLSRRSCWPLLNRLHAAQQNNGFCFYALLRTLTKEIGLVRMIRWDYDTNNVSVEVKEDIRGAKSPIRESYDLIKGVHHRGMRQWYDWYCPKPLWYKFGNDVYSVVCDLTWIDTLRMLPQVIIL